MLLFAASLRRGGASVAYSCLSKLAQSDLHEESGVEGGRDECGATG